MKLKRVAVIIKKIQLIIKDNLSQIFALTENYVKLKLRFKSEVLMNFFTPIVAIIMPIIVMGQFFSYNVNFDPWNSSNFFVFILLAYNITLLQQIILTFPRHLYWEKFWQTLPGLLIAPFNRFNLLLSLVFSYLASFTL